MNELVEIKKNNIFCDSQMVARKFEQKHAFVVKIIKNLQRNLDDLRVVPGYPKMITEEREYRGKKYTACLMNREFFSLLAMRFRGKNAFEWQVKFNAAFYDLESQLLIEATNKKNDGWVIIRQQGKITHRETTDVIKEFVGYATAQGSQNAKHYYKHISCAVYKALGLMVQKNPKLKDTLGISDLCNITTAEFLAQKSIKKYMEDDIPYKKIYDFVKEDLEIFANSLLIGEVREPV